MSTSKPPTLATLVTVSCFALSLGGCNKEKEADKSTAGDSKNAAPTTATGDDMRVRPPTAKDLKRYTQDLTGDGPLVATIETSKGVLHCELFEDGAPITVANFVGLARGLHPFRDAETSKAVKRPYYDGLTFHRVMPGFMIQGGDPLGVGTGGPGYKFTTEVSPNLKHDRVGILSMANGGKNTNGSQFFIMDGTRSQLDGGYNVFGHCKEADVIKAIASVETKPGGEGSTPVEPPTMNKITIARGMPQ